jgi:hypothetical protein
MNLRGEITPSEVGLGEGKNAVLLEGKDQQGKLVASKKVRCLRLKIFPDVRIDYWVAQPISLLAMQGIISGYPNGTFKPLGNITRAEMCTLLMKSETRNPKSETNPNFQDLKPDHWAAKYIIQAAEQGVVKGYPDGTFRPNGNITRAEGLAMIARFAGIKEEVWTSQFPDISHAFWAAPIISGSYNAGLLEYLKGKDFKPKRLLTRAETVEMLYRTQYVKDLLARDLLNWETY